MGKGVDRLNIVSMNAAGRNGNKDKDFKRSYLAEILGSQQPDLLLLPGDSTDMQRSVVMNYEQFMVPHNKETVLIYDPKRLQMIASPWNLWIPGIDTGKMVFPTVNVLCPPQKGIVKTFQCVTWHWEITVAPSDHRCMYAKKFMMFAELLALIFGSEVLIGGDFNLPLATIKQLIKEHNELIKMDIDCLKPEFQKMGLMDCMTDNVMRPQRRLRQLKLHECKALPGIHENPNYFVSSKELQLLETNTLQVESVTGKFTSMKALEYCPPPAQTQMNIPARPPRHYGG